MIMSNCNKTKAEQTADPSKYPQGYFKPKPCRCCKKVFTPKAPSELYCSDTCKDKGYNECLLATQLWYHLPPIPPHA